MISLKNRYGETLHHFIRHITGVAEREREREREREQSPINDSLIGYIVIYAVLAILRPYNAGKTQSMLLTETII